MSNAWQYKEDTWRENVHREYVIIELKRQENMNSWTLGKLKKDIQKEKGKNKQKNLYLHIIPDYEIPAGKRKEYDGLVIHLGFNGTGSDKLFSVDKKGYPIENSKQIHKDFLTPPVDFADAQKQVEKLNRDICMDFPTWLGHHSREGWEIFKISRDFRDDSHEKRTWCVFRRKI